MAISLFASSSLYLHVFVEPFGAKDLTEETLFSFNFSLDN